MDGGEYHHGVLIRVNIGNLLIHVKQVTVLICNGLLAQTLDSVLEIQEYGQTGVVYTVALVATLLGCT